MGYQYKICYKKGDSNKATDALSQATHTPDMLSAISVANPIGFNPCKTVIFKMLSHNHY
jgi:hypothetical protein